MKAESQQLKDERGMLKVEGKNLRAERWRLGQEHPRTFYLAKETETPLHLCFNFGDMQAMSTTVKPPREVSLTKQRPGMKPLVVVRTLIIYIHMDTDRDRIHF